MENPREDIIKDLIAEHGVKGSKAPKDPKGSARQKYNRRKLWLGHALQQMEHAIEDLLAQDGTVYKRQEIDTLKAAIGDFKAATGLKAPEPQPPTQEEMDGFIDMLSNLKPWEPPSKQELAELYASIGQAVPGEDEPDNPERASEAR